MAWWVRFRWHVSFKQAVADARYGTSANVTALHNNGIMSYIPRLTAAAQTRRANDKFPLALFHYDPQRRFYKAQPEVCHQCAMHA